MKAAVDIDDVGMPPRLEPDDPRRRVSGDVDGKGETIARIDFASGGDPGGGRRLSGRKTDAREVTLVYDAPECRVR